MSVEEQFRLFIEGALDTTVSSHGPLLEHLARDGEGVELDDWKNNSGSAKNVSVWSNVFHKNRRILQMWKDEGGYPDIFEAVWSRLDSSEESLAAAFEPLFKTLVEQQKRDILNLLRRFFEDDSSTHNAALLRGSMPWYRKHKKQLLSDELATDISSYVRGMKSSFSHGDMDECNAHIRGLFWLLAREHFEYSRDGFGFVLDSVSHAFNELGFLSRGETVLTKRGAAYLKGLAPHVDTPEDTPDDSEEASDEAKIKWRDKHYLYVWWIFESPEQAKEVAASGKFPRQRGTDRRDVREVGEVGRTMEPSGEKTQGVMYGRYLIRGIAKADTPTKDRVKLSALHLQKDERIGFGAARIKTIDFAKMRLNMRGFLDGWVNGKLRMDEEEIGPWKWSIYEDGPSDGDTDEEDGSGQEKGFHCRTIVWDDGAKGLRHILEQFRQQHAADQPMVTYEQLLKGDLPGWCENLLRQGQFWMSLESLPGIGVDRQPELHGVDDVTPEKVGDGRWLFKDIPWDTRFEATVAHDDTYFGIAPGKDATTVHGFDHEGMNSRTGLPHKYYQITKRHPNARAFIIVQQKGVSPAPSSEEPDLKKLFKEIDKAEYQLKKDEKQNLKWYDRHDKEAIVTLVNDIFELRQRFPQAFKDAKRDQEFHDAIVLLYCAAKSYKVEDEEFQKKHLKGKKPAFTSKNVVGYIQQAKGSVLNSTLERLRKGGFTHKDLTERIEHIKKWVEEVRAKHS